jgi:uncharacterized protein YhjY with autotransporter beta-barrel domain
MGNKTYPKNQRLSLRYTLLSAGMMLLVLPGQVTAETINTAATLITANDPTPQITINPTPPITSNPTPPITSNPTPPITSNPTPLITMNPTPITVSAPPTNASILVVNASGSLPLGTGGLPLPPGQVIDGPVKRRDGTAVTISSGVDANLYIRSTPPTESFVGSGAARAVITTAPTQYIRFYTAGVTNPVGGFIVGSNAVRGLTADQLRDKLATPYRPDSYTIVQVPAGTCLLVGTAAPITGNFPANPPSVPTPGPWGRGGVVQGVLIGKNANPSDCGGAQFLDPASYINRQPIATYALAYRPRAGFGNAGAVAAALDLAMPPALFTDADGVYNKLDVLNFGNPAALQYALTQLDGEAYADTATVEIVAAQMFQRVVHDQMRLGRGSGGLAGNIAVGALTGDADSTADHAAVVRPWISGFGGAGGLGGNGDSHNLNYNAQGVAGGIDHRFTSAVLAGLALGYTHSNFNTSGISGNGYLDTFSVETYASYAPGSWYVDGMLGYAYNQGTLNRSIVFPSFARSASGNPNASQFQSSVEAGYHFALDERTVLTPLAGMQGIAVFQDSFNESGAGAVNLQVRSQNNASARSTLGAELSHGLTVGLPAPLLLTLRSGWGHDYADVNRTITASLEGVPSAVFSTHGAKAARDMGLVGFGASLTLKSVNLFLRYDGSLAGDYSMHTGTAGLRISY